MLFKRLEIFGFKSFARQTKLEFHPGITAIVGPNGCGKSNISDSIKWVLGEQSAKSLRGSRMEDVIFNGASAEEPVNYAEVGIVFENTDRRLPIPYDEVVISRRLYRSGESEYLLNRNTVRLKDIQSLLAGTGLGVGNYSVIEQGRIDQVLTAKPEDRRHLFEEAAGITSYKSKKKETLRNLEVTELNLQRINDILQELKRQISSLERQAKKAEKYKREFAALKSYDLSVSELQLSGLNRSAFAIEERLSALNQAFGHVKEELTQHDERLRAARDAFQHFEQIYSETKAQHLVMENQLTTCQEKMKIFGKYAEEADGQTQEIARTLFELKERLSSLEGEREKLQREFADAERAAAEGETKLHALQAECSLTENQISQIETETSVYQHRQKEIAETKNEALHEVKRLQGATATLEKQRVLLDEEILHAQDEAGRIRFEQARYDSEFEKLSSEVRQNIQEKETLEHRLQMVSHEAEANQAKMRAIEDDMLAIQSKLKVFEAIMEKHEGYSQGARYLLESRSIDMMLSDGMLGPLADLVDVPAGYEAAIGAALRDLSDSLVFKTRAHAEYAAEKLRSAHKGKALLLFSEHEDRPFPYVEAPAGYQSLKDILSATGNLNGLLSRLVCKVFVAQDGQDAATMSNRYPELIFVTKTGELYKSNLMISGEQILNEENLLFGRVSRIREMKSQIAELSIEQTRLSTILVQAEDSIQSLKRSLKEFGEFIPKLQVKLADVESSRNHARESRQKLDSKLSAMEEKFSGLNQLLSEHSTDAERYTQLHRGLAEEEINIRTLLEQAMWHKETLEKKKDELVVHVTKEKTLFENIHVRFVQSQEALSRVVRMIESEKDSETKKTEDLSVLRQRLEETRVQIAELELTQARIQDERQKWLEEHNALIQERDEKKQDLLRVEAEHQNLQESFNSLQKALHDFQMQIQEKTHEISRIKEKIWDHYQVALEDNRSCINDEGDFEAVSAEQDALFAIAQEMEETRQRLASIGNVNLIAVEEYDDLRERHEFLTREHQDLLQAKDDIHKALLKINRTTREMFIETFTQIQSYFTEYYKLLFNGGHAEIVLLEEGDVLESGIEIVARPPGKKLQTISLLSGGEKALTAIALMLAVFKVKPSPFCVLDEIDAPLDDVNVQRFAAAIGEFVKESQFIVITHNKRTMSAADAMYGVTMHRSGVSSIVSVKFEDIDHKGAVIGKVDRAQALQANLQPSEN